MRFRVGKHVYAVKLAAEPLFDDAGERLCAIVDYDKRQILLAQNVHPKDRRRALLHELYHAWEDAEGMWTVDPEHRAEWFAVVMDRIVAEFESAGGTAALSGMGLHDAPRMLWERYAHALADAGGEAVGQRRPCGYCGQVWAAGSVKVTRGATDRRFGVPTCFLTLGCGNCQHVTTWAERANQAGWPTGDPIGDVQVQGGEAYRSFAAVHPAACEFFPAS